MVVTWAAISIPETGQSTGRQVVEVVVGISSFYWFVLKDYGPDLTHHIIITIFTPVNDS